MHTKVRIGNTLESLSMEMGQRLREERDRVGVSQQGAALLAGVTRAMWGRYEADQAKPNAEVLMHLLGHAFDVNYILGGSRTLSESTLSEKEELVLHCYRCTDDEGRASIERLSGMEAARVTHSQSTNAKPKASEEPKLTSASH